MKGYTQKDIQDITGISGNTIQLWAKDKLVVPSLSLPKTGKSLRRATRLYSAQDMILIGVLSTLADFGYNRILLKSFSEFMHKRGRNGKLNKENILNPKQFQESKIITLEFGDKRWEWREGLRTDERVEAGIILEAKRPTVAEIMNDNRVVIWINVSKVAKEIIKRL